MSQQSKAIIMAGGTGGHIFPGIALAEELKAQGWQVDWIGTADRMEADLVPKHGLPIHFIEVSGVRGNGLIRKLKMPLMLLNAFKQARSILKELKPDVVVGFGGYASGPGGLAAKSLGIPLILHEQNAVMGMTNRYLSRFAKKVLLAFNNTSQCPESDRVEVVGNPVRADIAQLNNALKRPISDHSQTHILVIGGSLGAKVLNENVAKQLTPFTQLRGGLQIRHQAGKGNSELVLNNYLEHGFDTKAVTVTDFVDDMTEAYRWADLVICRAGALTVSEVAASGNAAVFVPLPHAVDDHQTANAMSLVDKGAARIVAQSELETKLPEVLHELLHAPNLIEEMQLKAKQNANLGTTARMLSLCQAFGSK